MSVHPHALVGFRRPPPWQQPNSYVGSAINHKTRNYLKTQISDLNFTNFSVALAGNAHIQNEAKNWRIYVIMSCRGGAPARPHGARGRPHAPPLPGAREARGARSTGRHPAPASPAGLPLLWGGPVYGGGPGRQAPAARRPTAPPGDCAPDASGAVLRLGCRGHRKGCSRSSSTALHDRTKALPMPLLYERRILSFSSCPSAFFRLTMIESRSCSRWRRNLMVKSKPLSA